MEILLPLLLFPYVIAVLMPSWRWLLGCALIVGGFFTYLWVEHWIVSSTPGYKEGPGGAIGIAMVFAATAGFAGGVLVRAASLFVRARGGLVRAFVVNVLGFPALLGLLAAPAAWDAWRLRPPSPECKEATFNVDVAGLSFALPPAPIFNVYLGRHSASDAYYFGLGPSLRNFCSLNDQGKLRTRATRFWVRFEKSWEMDKTFCADPGATWAAALCAASPFARRGRVDEADFPTDSYVFVLKDVALGEFLGSASTYEDSLADPRRFGRDYFVRASVLTDDGNPLTFRCYDMSDGYRGCQTSYPWRGGTHLGYRFRSAATESIEEKGVRVDAKLKAFVAPLQTLK